MFFFNKGLAVWLPAYDNFGVGDGAIWLDEVSCIGDEDSIFDCQSFLDDHDCQHSEDVGLQCSNEGLKLKKLQYLVIL